MIDSLIDSHIINIREQGEKLIENELVKDGAPHCYADRQILDDNFQEH